MPRAFVMTPTAPFAPSLTARLGAGTGGANNLSDSDLNKFVKLVAESRYDLCAVGNEIEGQITSVEPATQGGFSIGGVINEGRMYVTFDGLQATPGTGTVVAGDYVVTGTPVAKGTALTVPPRVCKATAAATGIVYKWRIVSLGTAGTGAVGTVGVIEQVG
jgi:hypothetical protein